MIERKNRMAKVYVLTEIMPGTSILLPQTADLEDSELIAHFHRAMEGEDYDWAEAIDAEARSRNIQLVWR